MYCKNCLKQIIEKLNDKDVILLEYLHNESATMPQCSMSWQTISDYFQQPEQKGEDITPHVVYSSMKRLNIFGFVETQKWTRKNKYYLTDDGLQLLNLISKSL